MTEFYNKNRIRLRPETIKPLQSIDGKQFLKNALYSEILLNFEPVKEVVLNKLSKELKPSLYYHNLSHTVDVLCSIQILAVSEQVDEEEFAMIIAAALFHDTGFIWSYHDNEVYACRFAESELIRFGYTQEQIDRISGLIMATSMPQRPQNKLEMILCDADLDYLGREDFFFTALRLHREWSENSGKKIPFKDWYEKQRDFMKSHKYFTNSAQSLRNEKKLKNLSQVIELLDLMDHSTNLMLLRSQFIKESHT
ncbi:MAG TPA: HD domain-containing protein [Bacteroidales bacterium]|nr:HD domain-containing protein [Bacteroidales bacterium]